MTEWNGDVTSEKKIVVMSNLEQIVVNGRKGIGKRKNGNQDKIVTRGMVVMTIDRGQGKMERISEL